MFIAHLPTGYIIARAFIAKNKHVSSKKLIFFSMFGAFFPDIDMLYFHLIDKGKIHHHEYFTHYPIVWFGLLALYLLYFNIYYFIFILNGCMHLILDSLVGDILWLAPFSHKYFSLFIVTARYKPWWLNFIFHWSFVLELSILLVALYLYFKQRNKSYKGID